MAFGHRTRGRAAGKPRCALLSGRSGAGGALGAAPTTVADNLDAQQVEAQAELERNWAAMQQWLGELLVERGVDRISAEELTVPPGMDELFSLLEIKRHHEQGEFDAIVVDCAPTGETLRLLSFPDVAHWWLEKVFPWERRLVSAARPLARGLLDIPLPSDAVFEDVQRLVENLVAMNAILRDRSTTSLRLVMNPDRMVVKESMRTFTYLNLYGYLTDAVVVNRVLPDEAAEGYFAPWHEAQRDQMELVRSAFAPVPVLTTPHLEREVLGSEMLERLGAELFPPARAGTHAAGAGIHAASAAAGEPWEVLHAEISRELVSDNGSATLRLPLPGASKAEIDLKKIGLEVIVRVGPHKRTIMLPGTMAAHRPRAARFEDGTLEVRFERDEEAVEADGAR